MCMGEYPGAAVSHFIKKKKEKTASHNATHETESLVLKVKKREIETLLSERMSGFKSL